MGAGLGHLIVGVTSGCAPSGRRKSAVDTAPIDALAEALAAFGVAAEDAAAVANGPGTFHAALYDALYALDPATLDTRAHINEL